MALFRYMFHQNFKVLAEKIIKKTELKNGGKFFHSKIKKMFKKSG